MVWLMRFFCTWLLGLRVSSTFSTVSSCYCGPRWSLDLGSRRLSRFRGQRWAIRTGGREHLLSPFLLLVHRPPSASTPELPELSPLFLWHWCLSRFRLLSRCVRFSVSSRFAGVLWYSCFVLFVIHLVPMITREGVLYGAEHGHAGGTNAAVVRLVPRRITRHLNLRWYQYLQFSRRVEG